MIINLKGKKTFLLLFAINLIAWQSSAQKPDYTADERVDAFGVPFGYGFNPGYYLDKDGNNFNPEGLSYDVALSELASKIGLNSSRPTLPCYFFLQYGNSTSLGTNNFQIRSSEFSAYQTQLVKNQVVFIGDATDHQNGALTNLTKLVGSQYRNLVTYPGCNLFSYEFKNLYTPIWDNGENGTAINDTNYYALYIYKLVNNYKNYIKVYEIVNEIDYPDGFDASKGPGNDGWYDRAPKPCELLNWKAPIYSYIRTMRIAYEVIKSIDPEAFIAIGGIGNESFLDATLRYSDNPIDGSTTTDYPKKGGAYFDVLSYHHYPQYDLKKKDANGNNVYPFVYQRHSDEAVKRTVYSKKATLQTILTKYGYDGTSDNFPLKEFIITEANIPRRTYDGQDWIGSDAAQRNYLMKLFIKAQTNDINQVHVFSLGEKNDLSDVSNKEGHEGFYQNLCKSKRTTATRLQSGVGTKTLTYLIGNSTYDATQTALMAIPSSIDGAAFKSSGGKYIYAIWAKTSIDNSEEANARYTFPAGLGISGVMKADWDFASTNIVSSISSNIVTISGTPTFFSNISEPILAGIFENKPNTSEALTLFPIPAHNKLNIVFKLDNTDLISLKIFGIDGNLKKTLLDKVKLSSDDHFYEFENINLVSGLYFIKLTSIESGKVISSKLLIED